MTNTKSTKRALLSSVLALFLCFAMLLGTTFAWFTDSVTNGVNKIVSGNLDVELYHMNYAQAVEAGSINGMAIPKEDEGYKVDENTKLFLNEDGKEMLWEPGATSVENFRIVNEGSLALKYQFKIEFFNATKTPEGKTLADIINISAAEIEYAEVTGYPHGVDGNATLDDRKLGTGHIFEGYLLPGESYNFWIGLQWVPSDEDNEYNVEGGLEIDLGITLLATQYTYEKDNYEGDQYDSNSDYATAVETASALAIALRSSGRVKIANDITVDETLVVPTGVSVELDLNGNSIIGNVAKGAVLENNGVLTLTGGTIRNTAVNGASTIKNNGTLVLDGAAVVGAPIGDTGYPAYAVDTYGKLTVEEGSTIISDRGAIYMNNGSDVVINGGNIEVTDALGSRVLTSHVIYAYGENSTLTIKDGNFAQNYAAAQNTGASVICPAGATINIHDGNFSYAGTVGQSGIFQNFMGYSKELVNVYGGTFNDTTVNGNHMQKPLADGYQVVDNGDGTYKVIFPQSSFDSLIGNAQAGDTVDVPAGTYEFPASDLKAGMVLNCEEGTVFEGKTGFNINGATVIGATFTNDNDWISYQSTINGTFKDCVFTDCDGLRYCYAGETVVFENCVFDTDFYGVHFDGGANDVVFKNCTFTGFNAFGGAVTKLTMKDCTFQYNGKGGYNGINLWGDTEMTNCTFVFDGSATEFVDLCNDNKTVTFTNCVVTDGENETPIENVVGNYGVGNTIIVDGVYLVKYDDEDANEPSNMFKNAISAAIKEGSTVKTVQLSNGNYSMPDGGAVSLQGKTLTIKGTKDAVIDVSNVDERDQFVTNATLKFEGVTLNFGTALYMGFANTASLTYKDCVINGVQHLYGNSITFEGCTLNATGDYMVRTWGGKNVTFNGCTFNCDGKAILVYNQSCNLTVNNCIFNDNGDGTICDKAAIEACNGDGGANCVTHNIVVTNTTVNGFDVNPNGTNTDSTLWANKNSLDDAHLNVTIDGTVVY